jgi:hypothetical protein
MTIPRAALGVFALLFTVATVDVSRARAQTTTVTATSCGMGVLTPCGSEPITKCETTISFNLNLLLQNGGFTFSSTNCTTGYKTLYKDRKTTTTTTTTTAPVGPYPTCSETKSGTSGDADEEIALCEM